MTDHATEGNLSDKLAGFVLAGGKSSRMGRDKARVMLHGRFLVDIALTTLRTVTSDVSIVGDRQDLAEFAPIVPDLHPDSGPLGGLEAALTASRRELNAVLGVDTPFLSTRLLSHLLTRAEATGATITVPRVRGQYQPLCAVYRKSALPRIREALEAGRFKIEEIFTTSLMCVVEDEELEALGVAGDLFSNLNTPADLDAAERRLPGDHPSSKQARATAHERKPYIEFSHVSKAFGSLHVLMDVSFYVYPGETLCILGRSGVGKSVSLQNIMGFLKPDSGRVIVAYEDITDASEIELQRIRKKVTMVFQNGALFDSMTVGENVAFPLRERKDLDEEQIFQIVDGLLEMVGVAEMRDKLPSDLSTGMKRSVAIARALAAQPEAILYDEPTTMVDPIMSQRLGDLIQRLKFQLKLTSIVVTHDMRLAKKLADRVVFLHEGKAIFFGTEPEMEKSGHPIIREFLELDELRIPA